jgi:predicted pyridoxine 5'-phosphate oxidase superfamily flavin-nucleotide-binding protein
MQQRTEIFCMESPKDCEPAKATDQAGPALAEAAAIPQSVARSHEAPGAARPIRGAEMIKVTDQMRSLLNSALADGTPCLVGTATKDGYPQISPKGSVVVFNDDTLCYWERSGRSALKRVNENPHIVVYYRNVARIKEIPYRAGVMRFYGDARVLTSGADRDKVWELIPEAERKPDPEKKGTAVLVRLDRIEELSGNIIMQRE